MAAVGLLFALLFVAVVLGTVGLWYAIDRETAENPRMDRTDAERIARQDTDDDFVRDANGRENDEGDGQEDSGDDGWGSNAE